MKGCDEVLFILDGDLTVATEGHLPLDGLESPGVEVGPENIVGGWGADGTEGGAYDAREAHSCFFASLRVFAVLVFGAIAEDIVG